MLASAPIAPGKGHEAGHLLLSQLYRQAAGEEMPPILLSPMGKPYFADSPWHFSISHTPNWVFVALEKHPVGLDAEELTRQVSPKLAQKILSPGEYAQYEAAEDKNRALLTFWVLKEAQGKLTGEGVRPWPNHTNFSLDNPHVFTQDGCILALLEERPHAF